MEKKKDICTIHCHFLIVQSARQHPCDGMKGAITAEATVLPSHRIWTVWWTDQIDWADIKSGSRIWPGCRWEGEGVVVEDWSGGGMGEVGGGRVISRETGQAAECRWWLAAAPQLGPPPAWPLGAPLWIQPFVLPRGGQTNSRLIIHWDSNDTG